jgi:hypothetical protein
LGSSVFDARWEAQHERRRAGKYLLVVSSQHDLTFYLKQEQKHQDEPSPAPAPATQHPGVGEAGEPQHLVSFMRLNVAQRQLEQIARIQTTEI